MARPGMAWLGEAGQGRQGEENRGMFVDLIVYDRAGRRLAEHSVECHDAQHLGLLCGVLAEVHGVRGHEIAGYDRRGRTFSWAYHQVALESHRLWADLVGVDAALAPAIQAERQALLADLNQILGRRRAQK